MASELRVNKLTNRSGLGTVTYSDTGAIFTGIITATSFSGPMSGTTGTFTGDVSIADKIVHTGDTNTALRFPAADTITAETAGSERLRITSGGKVGINSTSPTNTLDVVGGYQGLGIYRGDYTGNAGAGIHLNLGRAKADGSLFSSALIAAVGSDNTGQAGELRFSTLRSGSLEEALRITTDGKVGINETTPACQLHVEHDNAHSSTWYLNSDAGIMIDNKNGSGKSILKLEGNAAIVYGGPGGELLISDRQTERLRIKSDGTVYTVTQGAKFGISQDPTLDTMGATSGTWQVPEVDGSVIGAEMRIGDHNTNSTAIIRLASYGSGDGGVAGGAIMFTNTRCGSNSHHSDLAAIKGARESLGRGYLRFFTADRAANDEKMRITSAGKLIVAPNTDTTTAFDYAGVYFSSDNSTVAEGLFLNNARTGDNTGDNVSLSFSTDSGNRKKSAISHVDTGSYGRGDLVFSIDPQADSGDLDIQAHEHLRIISDGSIRHTRSTNDQRYDLEFRQTGGIGTGNYSGVKWTQGSTGSTFLAAIQISYHDTGRPDMVFWQRDRGGSTGSDEAMRIDRDGTITVGGGGDAALAVHQSTSRGVNITRTGRIYCKTADHWDLNRVGTGEIIRFRKGADSGTQTHVGNITVNSSSVTYSQNASDSRLKKNIETWTDEVLPHFKTLQPKKFNYNWETDTDTKSKGYMAQDVTSVFPEAYPMSKVDVDGSEEDRYMFAPGGMVIYLMKALQEEIAKREALEARIAALEGS